MASAEKSTNPVRGRVASEANSNAPQSSEKKPVLKHLTNSTLWDSFRPHVDKCNLQGSTKAMQGANDRRSMEELIGLGVMNSNPDATAIGFFRERLRMRR